ncbi:MAG: cytochrome c oxidase subunit 3 [Chlamydiales bacterium]|nr:cytochrome c oxidase subunit 3 [Chlamydiales bacterium]
MSNPKTTSHENYPDTHHDVYSKTIFGFWVYLLTDFMLFATYFAVHAVLGNNTYGGASIKELTSLPFIVVQTLILLVCSFSSGLGGAFAHRGNKNWTVAFFSITFLFGLSFIGMEWIDGARLVNGGNSWRESAALTSYFNLIAMHGLHVIIGSLWIVVLLIPVLRYGITPVSVKRLTCLRMFWQFINVVWVLIFTIVYLMGDS